MNWSDFLYTKTDRDYVRPQYAYVTTNPIGEYLKHDDELTKSICEYLKDALPKERNKPMSKPKIKRVIFNKPATIIMWTDGTKTVVKCQDGDDYDMEKGFVMAYLKKLLGNDNTFNKEINKWVYGE